MHLLLASVYFRFTLQSITAGSLSKIFFGAAQIAIWLDLVFIACKNPSEMLCWKKGGNNF